MHFTYAINVYHHWCCELVSRSGRCVQHFGIKFGSDLRQICSFLRVLRLPPPRKLTGRIIYISVDVCNLADIYNRAPTIMGHVACFFILFYSVVTTFKLFVCLLLLNATFNNILVISWRSVFLVEEALCYIYQLDYTHPLIYIYNSTKV
jgi:hypothetical protein